MRNIFRKHLKLTNRRPLIREVKEMTDLTSATVRQQEGYIAELNRSMDSAFKCPFDKDLEEAIITLDIPDSIEPLDMVCSTDEGEMPSWFQALATREAWESEEFDLTEEGENAFDVVDLISDEQSGRESAVSGKVVAAADEEDDLVFASPNELRQRVQQLRKEAALERRRAVVFATRIEQIEANQQEEEGASESETDVIAQPQAEAQLSMNTDVPLQLDVDKESGGIEEANRNGFILIDGRLVKYSQLFADHPTASN